MRVSANGGTPEFLVKEVVKWLPAYPQILPDGKTVLFTDLGQDEPIQIVVQSLQIGRA